jgi:hypothetical protein
MHNGTTCGSNQDGTVNALIKMTRETFRVCKVFTCYGHLLEDATTRSSLFTVRFTRRGEAHG